MEEPKEHDEDDDEGDGDPDEYGSDDFGGWKPHPNSLANLRPPWKPGESGNPTGLTKDGRYAHSPRRVLEDKLHAQGGRRLHRLVEVWLKHANKGSAKHLEMILDRLDPLERDKAASAGRVIMRGVRLELPGGAKVELVEGERAQVSDEAQLSSNDET